MNATMCHFVAFKCPNDAKKKDLNIYFHMEPSENLNPWRKSIDFFILDDVLRECVG